LYCFTFEILREREKEESEGVKEYISKRGNCNLCAMLRERKERERAREKRA
jgi:hypothetical protein